MAPPIDYAALAAQARKAAPAPQAAPAGKIDYAALATQARGGATTPPPPPPAPAPAGNEIKPAPAPSEWQRLKNTVANSAIGRSVESFNPRIADALGITPTETVNSPTYEGDRQQPLAPQYIRPDYYTPSARTRGGNFANGILTGAGKLTSADSVATGVGLAATGGLAAPLAPIATTLKVAGAGMGAYGVGRSLYGAGKAYTAGDTAGGDEQMGEAVPNAAMMLPAAWDAIQKLPNALIRKPLTKATDVPMPGTTITPRQRYESARRLGAQYDAADATGSPALGMVKRFNRDSLVGSPVYDEAAAKNTAAVRQATTDALHEMSPLEPAQGGALIQRNLKANQTSLRDSANSKFDLLDSATGQPVPGAAQVGQDAQTILQNETPFYTKYPSMKPGTAISALEDLGKVGDTASYSELQRLRSNTHELTTANNDLVKEQGTGWLQQMTHSLDNAITDKGLTPQQASMFRDANGDWADMKEQYDNPSSPLYHAVRSPNPSTLSQGVGAKTPEMLANLKPRIGADGMGALQRGNTEKLLGNTALDDYNFRNFGRKLYAQPEAYRSSLYGPEMSGRLDDIARTTQGIGTDFNPSGSGKQVQKVAEGTALLTAPLGHPTGLLPLAQYPIARAMNSPRVVDWLMKQPGGSGGAGIPPVAGPLVPPPTAGPENGSPSAAPTSGPPSPKAPKYMSQAEQEQEYRNSLDSNGNPKPLPTPATPPAAGLDSTGKPLLRPERPQPTAPTKPYAPQVRRDSNIRDIQPLTPKGKPAAAAAAPQAQMTLGEQAPAAPTEAPEVKVTGPAENLAKGPDLSHLNQQVPALDGASTHVHTAGGGKLPATYRVLEADTVIPSHNAFSFRPNPDYPEGVQERDYFGNRENQLRVIQHAQNYEPDLTISDNPDAINGPPVVTPNGVALGGNSRVMSTQRLYGQDGKGGVNYKNYLMKKASQYGMDPEDIQQMRKPILVREVQSDGSTESLHKIGALLNKPMTGSLSSTERAVSMGKTLSPDTIKTVRGMLDEGEGGSTLRDVMGNASKSNALLMRMQADGLISSEERPQYVDTTNGGMNEEGKRVFEKALLGSVMGDANLMENAPKNITAKLNASIGPLSELGARPDAWNVIPALRTAIGEHTKMAAANMGVDDYLKQGSMFGKPLSPVEEHLTRVLGQNHNAVRDGFSLYGKDARYSLPGQATFLGPAPHDAFNYAFKSNLGPEEFSKVKPLEKK